MKSVLSIFAALLSIVLLVSDFVTDKEQDRLLVFSKTAGFHHASIAAGARALQNLGTANGLSVDTTTSAAVFTDDGLAPYGAVVFLNTTGDVLDENQQAAFERFVRSGRGYVGIHSATDTEYDWPWYGNLVGAYFVNHPAIQEAELTVVDSLHASTRHLPRKWVRTDEWYNLKYVNPDVHVLIELEESSYLQPDGRPGSEYHPIAWLHEFDGGRAFYTGLGHTDESYSEDAFLAHLLGGIEYVLGRN